MSWSKTALLAAFVLGSALPGAAQQKAFWLEFSYKGTPEQGPALSAKALERRSQWTIPVDSLDYPVNPEMLQALRFAGLDIRGVSRWNNAALVVFPEGQPFDWSIFPFLKKVTELGDHPRTKPVTPPNPPDWNADLCWKQKHRRLVQRQEQLLSAQALRNQGQGGRGIDIAVLDIGFRNWQQHATLQSTQVLSTWDVLRRDTVVSDQGWHGTQVLSIMAGKVAQNAFGICPAANYHLMRTELEASEFPAEMYYWIIALERADSLGADLVCSSLGYYEFDDPSRQLQPQELDGITLPIARAATVALAKGMPVVVSAGNEGKKEWQIVTTPADSPGALAVGAVRKNGKKAKFSSMPSPQMNQPLVYALGKKVLVSSWHPGKLRRSSGTSYAAPQIAGWLACLLRLRPDLSPQQLVEAIREEAAQSADGIPDLARLLP